MKILLFLLIVYGKSPRVALFLSILPGGGHFYTENYIKGSIFCLTQSVVGFYTIKEHILAQKAKKENNQNEYEYHSRNRYNGLWLCSFVWFLSMGDAYVSAHFYGFDKQTKLEIGYRI